MADIEQRLKFIMDRGAQRQAEQGIRSLRDTIDDAAKGTQRAARGANQMEAALADVGQEARRVNAALDDIEKNRKIKVDASDLDNATRFAQDRFDRTSRGVALAGDVQSNLGALSGLAGAAGAGGLGSGIAAGGEVVALIEELPRLKTAVQGMPQTIASAASALGTTSTGLLGALGAVGIALIAAGAAWQAIQKEIQKTTEIVKASSEAIRSLNRLRADDATGEDLRQTQQDLQAARDAALADLEDFRNRYDSVYNDELNAIQDTFGRLFSPTEAQWVRDIEESEQRLRETSAALETFNSNLTASEQAAIAAAEAEEQREAFMAQQEELAAGVLTEASRLAELNEFRRDSIDLTQEEINAKMAELEARRIALNDELRVLQQSGNQSDSVRNRIDALNGELGQLDSKLKILSETTATAADETERAARSVAPARNVRGGFLLNGRGGSGFAQGTPAVNAALQEVYNEFAVKAFEAQAGLSESLRDVNKALGRSFEDLRINQERDIKRAIRGQDILAIRTITEGVREQAEDLNRNAARSRVDIEQDFNTQMINLAQDRRNAILEAERQITESVKRTASRIGGLVLPSGNNGFSFGSAPRT